MLTRETIYDIPINEVKKENSIYEHKLLHRNMPLTFVGLPGPDEEVIGYPRRDKRNVEEK